MPSIASIPVDLARTLLNDDDAITWPDFRILPKLRQAFIEATTSFLAKSIPITIEVTVEMVLAQGDTIVNNISNFPTNFEDVIHLQEKQPGETISSYRLMIQRDFLPLVPIDTRLVWFTYQGDQIITLGAQNDIDLIMDYRKRVEPPIFLTDTLELNGIDDYLAYKITSLCYASIGNKDQAMYFGSLADANLDQTLRMKVRNEVQPLRAKRQGYHRKWINRNAIGTW